MGRLGFHLHAQEASLIGKGLPDNGLDAVRFRDGDFDHIHAASRLPVHERADAASQRHVI